MIYTSQQVFIRRYRQIKGALLKLKHNTHFKLSGNKLFDGSLTLKAVRQASPISIFAMHGVLNLFHIIESYLSFFRLSFALQ